MAISRPDISYGMLLRKRSSIEKVLKRTSATTIATNCPSCLSGLGRNRDLGFTPRHMAVLLAEKIGGKTWLQELSGLVYSAEKVTF
jgi:Fe-S oxidoreductase